MIQQRDQKKSKPKPKYKVIWMGSKHPEHQFEKYFFKKGNAAKMSKRIDGALILEHQKTKGNGALWHILPTKTSKELIANIKVARKLKSKYSSADGDQSTITTQNFESRQKMKLFKGLVISPFLIYTGITYNLPPIFRVGLVAGGAILGINELKYYMINKKAQKSG